MKFDGLNDVSGSIQMPVFSWKFKYGQKTVTFLN